MSEMTISQCLRRVSKLKGNLKELTDRAAKSVSYEQDSPPAFKFKDSLEEAKKVSNELVKLEAALRVTNALTTVGWWGQQITLAEATCRLQEIKGNIAWLKGLHVRAQETTSTSEKEYDSDSGKYVKATVITKCDLPEAARAKMVADAQEEFDTLNDVVENANHRTTLK